MTTYLGALAAVAVSLAILMALAWVVQQRAGNSGGVDTTWNFTVDLVGADSARWPVSCVGPRQWLIAAQQAQMHCSFSARHLAYQAQTTFPAREDVVA
jgi:steroid 5-alpha reductase family enzyme